MSRSADGDAGVIRGVLESFGARVDYSSCWTPQQLVDALNADDCGHCRPEHVLICGHGGEDSDGHHGILVDELSPELYDEQPFKEALTGQRIRKLVRLNGQTLVCTPCSSGKLAESFLAAGASSCIAPAEDEDGMAAVFYVIALYYGLLALKLPLEESARRAAATDDECGLFRVTASS